MKIKLDSEYIDCVNKIQSLKPVYKNI